jgi:hypothetical protein
MSTPNKNPNDWSPFERMVKTTSNATIKKQENDKIKAEAIKQAILQNEDVNKYIKREKMELDVYINSSLSPDDIIISFEKYNRVSIRLAYSLESKEITDRFSPDKYYPVTLKDSVKGAIQSFLENEQTGGKRKYRSKTKKARKTKKATRKH